MENVERIENAEANQLSLVSDDNGEKFIVDLTNRATSFCSIDIKKADNKTKAKLFNAMNNTGERLGDHINETIEAKDLFCEVVTCTNESGESTQCPRIVVIDKDGKGYQAVSIGVWSAFKKLIGMFGQPTWETPIKLKIKQITKGDRKMLTFDVVG